MSTLTTLAASSSILDLEPLLREEPAPERRGIWHPGWRGRVPTRSIEHLIVLMSLVAADDFGGLSFDGDDAQRWAQAKRRGRGWIVEVRDCTTNDWPQRIHRGCDVSYIRTVVPDEPCLEEHFRTAAAAEIMWTWLHGAVPVGHAAAVPVD